MPTTESLVGVSPQLDDHVQGTIARDAESILREIALELGEGYEAEQHSAQSEVWREWEKRVIEPLKPVAADGVHLPISFKEKGAVISAGIALTMTLTLGRRKTVEDTQAARNQTRGMSRYNNHKGGIVLGEGRSGNHEITKAAQTLGFTIGTRKVDDPDRYWPLPIKGKRVAPFVNAQELQDFAEERLRSLFMGSQVVGVVFKVTDKVYGYDTLAKSIVRDPDEPLAGFSKDEQTLIGELNPYARIMQKGIGAVLGIDDKEVLGFAHERSGRPGRQYLENALIIKAKKEQQAIRRMQDLREQVLDSVTGSEGYKKRVAQAQAL